ncbi:MAG: WD40/YVTN/BNR-like repeat-containing protein, partial [Flavobacterium sp.]
FNSVALKVIFQDSLSIRAIKIINDKIWYVSQQGKYGILDFEGKHVFEGVLERNDIPCPLRGVATDGTYVYILSIQKPAAIYRHLLSDLSVFENVFEDLHPEAFLNSIAFDKNGVGVVYGDTYNQDLYLLKTNDGKHWERVTSSQLPKMNSGEHAFAASNSVAVVNNNQIWLASGGSNSNVYYSKDVGEVWSVQKSPIVSGEQMKGIFSMDFYDSQTGIIGGGDYDQPNLSEKNLAITHNGGKEWKEVRASDQKTYPGFISCVKFVPGGSGDHLVTMGSNGIYYSPNKAMSWEKFSDENQLYVFEFLNQNRAVAAGKNKIVVIDFIVD